MQCISTKRALLAFIACALSSATAGGSFTNHVGHAVSGELTAMTNGVVVIGSRSYPLSIFPEAEQTRMRALLALPAPLPPKLVALRRSLNERAKRADALFAAGAMTEDESIAKRAKLESIWARALDADDTLSQDTRKYWRSRLWER